MKRVDPGVAAILLALSTAFGRAAAQDGGFAQHGAVIGGAVHDLHGMAQLGALVELLGTGSSVVAHTYTDDHGRYVLEAPQPGRYELRTSAAFLLPAMRRNLRLKAGTRTLANMTMSAVFDVGDWFPVAKRRAAEPADDWRWTLRSSAERPLLRLAGSSEDSLSEIDHVEIDLPNAAATGNGRAEEPGSARQREQLGVQYRTAGVIDSGLQQTWQTERAGVSGSVVSVLGSVGVPTTGDRSPTLFLSTGFQQTNSAMHSQYRAVAGVLSLPDVLGAGGEGYAAATLATGERVVLGDLVTIDAGTLLSAERLVSSRVSTAPFLRLAVHPASDLAAMYRYTGSRAVQTMDDLASDRVLISPMSDGDGRPIGNAAAHQELAFSRFTDRDVTTFAMYRDRFASGAIEGGNWSRAQDSGDGTGGVADLPLVANTGSGYFVLAVHGYTGHGVSASWTHKFTEDLTATTEADFGTTLAIQGSGRADIRSLGSRVLGCSRPALTAEVAGKVPKTATSVEVRYHWQPKNTLTVINTFNNPENKAYTSVLLKQRLWHSRQLKSVNAVLEASNLLEEGYQPVLGPDGQTLFLAQVPRSVQAGLTFSF